LKSFIIRDGARKIATLQTEQGHTVDGPTPTWLPQIMSELVKETNGRLKANLLLGSNVRAFVLNMSKPPFDNVRIRKAIFLGLDRQNIVDVALTNEEFGAFGLAGTFFPPGPVESPEALFAANAPGYRLNKAEDIAEAKALLIDAGYSYGFKADLNYGNSVATTLVPEALPEQLRRELGIDFTLKPVGHGHLSRRPPEWRSGGHHLGHSASYL
jgi:ABC-type transport system substrate-binding protein